MYTQKEELRVISIERGKENVYRYSAPQSSAARRRKRRLRQRRKMQMAGALGVVAVLLLVVCYRTNWFTELPALRSAAIQSGKIEFLEKKVKEQPEDYPQELLELLEQNGETYDFVENYSKREEYKGREIDLSDSVKEGDVPLLMQWDKRWGYDLYGDSMIGLAGCGPTCMTMAYLYYTGDLEMNPRKMAEYAQDNGYHSEEGTSWSFWTDGAAGIGLYGEQISLSQNGMQAVLDNGGLVVCSMAPGDFTTTGHYILLRGYDENGFFVNDPNRNSNSEKQWDYDTLSTQMKNLWAIYP